MSDSGGKVQDKPKGRYVWLWLLVPIVLVAALFSSNGWVANSRNGWSKSRLSRESRR